MIKIKGKQWAELTADVLKNYIKSEESEESFFIEFKSDDVSTSQFAKEISAFANTYGGYLILGISDQKEIEGCMKWNEERIHTTIHDTVSPVPLFDVKTFVISKKTILIIKIEEGIEPPYITNNGCIYERVASGSYPIKDSSHLLRMIDKNERFLNNLESQLSIPPIPEDTNNVYGYIDIGFYTVFQEQSSSENLFYNTDLNKVISETGATLKPIGLHRIGNTINCSIGSASSNAGFIAANMLNFMVIMTDGSVKIRLLLFNNDNESIINLVLPVSINSVFQSIYETIMGELIPVRFLYAKKYEKLTVLKQFEPTVSFTESLFKSSSNNDMYNKFYQEALAKARHNRGDINIVTDVRYPYSGLRTIDRQLFDSKKIDYTQKNILNNLFNSSFLFMGTQDDLAKIQLGNECTVL